MKEIRDRYDEARSHWAEWRTRALEDLRFSNPANPEQWPEKVVSARGAGRPALVFDQTNQYIGQVVNDARQNKPGIDILPGDDQASDKAAEAFAGLIRQIEYASRAQMAYDTAIEYAARIGLGFVLVVPELQDGKHNDHEIRIKPVVDPLAVTFDPDSVALDGQDADCGWLETKMSEASFKRRWPKGTISSQKGDRWFDGNGVMVCQYFERTYSKTNRIITQDGRDFAEDDYHAESKKSGLALPVHSNYASNTPKTVWQWLSGEEVLEETVYPAPYIGIVPVYGNVLWIDGKRQVCGMTRRMMDGQRAYNYERSAYIEAVALSPKAPWLAPSRAIAKYQTLWDNSNMENRAVLPYDHVDAEGNPIPSPERQNPPAVGSAFVENAQLALSDIQASVGMYKSNLGQNSNAKSGIAINKLQTEGDTATFHYSDNQSASIAQIGRICVELLPTYMDRAKLARMLGVDGKPKSVKINPDLQTAHADGDTLEINPAIGTYDVRVKAGPSYTSMRQEMQDRLVNISQGNPQLGAAMAPLLLQQSDMPGADKAAKVALALLPPQVQKAYEDDNGAAPEIPPEVQRQMDDMRQQLQAAQAHIGELGQALNNASDQLDAAQAEAKASKGDEEKLEVEAYGKITDRLKIVAPLLTPELAQHLVLGTMQQALQHADPLPDEMAEGVHDRMPMGNAAQMAMQPPPDPAAQQSAQEPPTEAAFSLPEQG